VVAHHRRRRCRLSRDPKNGSKNARFFKTQFGKNLNFEFEKMADFSKFISKSQRTGDESIRIINSNKQTQGRGT
jgi:hypothetical protein